MNVLTICGVAVLTVLLTLIAKELHGKIGKWIPIAGGLLLSVQALILLVQATDGLSFSIPQPYSGYLKTVLQCFGSAVLIKLACDFAADLGETGLAEKVAFCGRCLLLLLLMPLFREFVALAEEMLQ